MWCPSHSFDYFSPLVSRPVYRDVCGEIVTPRFKIHKCFVIHLIMLPTGNNHLTMWNKKKKEEEELDPLRSKGLLKVEGCVLCPRGYLFARIPYTYSLFKIFCYILSSPYIPSDQHFCPRGQLFKNISLLSVRLYPFQRVILYIRIKFLEVLNELASFGTSLVRYI